ncbi:MAG: hypothetical protein WCP79_00705 [Bacillota bacterium]
MSEITLEKLDTIRERTGLGYKEAKDLLEKSNGEIMEALIAWEAANHQPQASSRKPPAAPVDTMNDVVGKLKDALADGQVKAAPYVEAGIKFLKNKYFK